MTITVHGSLAEACTQPTHTREAEEEERGQTGGQDLKKKTPKKQKNKKNKTKRSNREGHKEKRWQREKDIIECSHNEASPQPVQ